MDTPPSPLSPPPVPSTPPVKPVSDQKQHHGFLIVLLILILISLGITGYFAYQNMQIDRRLVSVKPTPTPNPTPDPTADWKTYTNEKYNISLLYPPAWKLENISNNTSTLRDGFESISLTGDDSAIPLAERQRDEYDKTHKIHRLDIIIPIKKYGSLQAYLKDNGRGVPGISNDYAKIETVNFGEIQAQKYTNTAETASDLWHIEVYLVYIPQTQKVFEIESSYTQLAKSEKWMNDQILSTFQFITTITPSPTQQPKPVRTLYYSVPNGWKTVQDATGSFSISYDPTKSKLDTNNSSGIVLLRQRPDPSLGFMSCETLNLYPYDGGSRHQFIYKYLGEIPTKTSLFANYKEIEYVYNGKSCLLLNGISISQYNTVWGMCDTGNGKAFLFTSCDRDPVNDEKILQTVQVLK